MRLAVGHANPDFDAYAATVAAAKLIDDTVCVFLGSQNANVREFHNLHGGFFPFADLRDLDLEAVTGVVMVDTRDPDRVGEIGAVVRREGVEVIVYDHHPSQEGDVRAWDDRSLDVGATTSILVHELMHAGVVVTPLEASLFALGIHEDTGSFTFPGTTAYDAEAVAWLMSMGADTEVLNQFLVRTLEPAQRELLDRLVASLEVWDVHGQPIAVGVAETDEYVDYAGVLTHHIVEDLGHRVAIGIVGMPERTQVVARSRVAEVDVGAVMARLGGGGHSQAASVGLREVSVDHVTRVLRDALLEEVKPPLRAADVMSAPVRTIGPDESMAGAGLLMSRWGHGGLPVVEDGALVGLVTRKDVDKATRHHLDHAPVRGFMGSGVTIVTPDTPLQELERIFSTRGFGRVPVVVAGRVVGIVTRKDVLRARHGESYVELGGRGAHPEATARFCANVDALLPEEARELIRTIGILAKEEGVRAHVVGGFVRDMLLGVPNLDIDVVVEGDGVLLARGLGAMLDKRVDVHHRFGTAVVVVSRDVHVDFASSRTEYYTKPGALPTVEPSTLRQDLFRRDFTINAMAACIDADCFGAIADPFGGLSDIESRTVRVLHALSFVDDPTRVLRAVRFERRYGFSLDPHSGHLAAEAGRMGLLSEVSGARIREELLALIAEADVVSAFERLAQLDAIGALLPSGADPALLIDELSTCVELRARLAREMPHRIPSAEQVILTAIASCAGRRSGERWVTHMRIGRQRAESAIALGRLSAGARRLIESERVPRDSRLYRALSSLPPAAVVVLAARSRGLGRERALHHLRDLAPTRLAVDGTDLLALGVPPGEHFSAILARALDDRLDGRAVGREAELANLRRLAVKAGLIDDTEPSNA